MEISTLPRPELQSHEVDKFGAAVLSKVNVAGATFSTLYAPVPGVGPPPSTPSPSVATGRRLRRRSLLQTTGARTLVIVLRVVVPAASLEMASSNLGAAFGSGELLAAVRSSLGSEYARMTVRSSASKQARMGAVSIFAGRISNQLVAPDQDPCRTDNGGCHGLVSCTADPSNVFTGVMCGPCPSGYAGDGTVNGTGCVDVDECADPTLANGGCSLLVVCSNVVGGRTCGPCPAGYEGDGVTCVDIDECARDNGGCDPLARCVNVPGGRECGACPAGYKGSGETRCARESACAADNGGCDPLTKCTDGGPTPGGSSCGPCPAGYVGDGASGCVDFDACEAMPCAPGVHCEDGKPPSTTRTCGPCPPGQLGDGVTCKANPCFIRNGGCDALSTCTATSTGNAVCGACPSGYERVPAGDQFAPCTNVDGCALEPCHPGVLCFDRPPPEVGRTCGACPSGYAGDGVTCVDIDECLTDNGGCDVNTACVNVPGSVECGPCPSWAFGSGTTGCKPKSKCSVNNGGCDPVAICEDNPYGVTCGPCPAGYEGTGETGCVDVDGCADNPCYSGVTCHDVRAPGTGFTCDPCPQGYRTVAGAIEGVSCEMCSVAVAIAASTAVGGAVPRGRDTRIIASTTLMPEACSNADGYVFRWSAARSDGTPVVLDPSVTKSDTPQLFLPRRSLPPGVSYTLRFEARQAVESRVTASVEYDFFVQSAALEATIAGGNVLLNEGASFSLDATGSIDPDDETAYPWEFTWRCEKTPAAAGDPDQCMTTAGTELELPRGGAPVLSGLLLAGGPGPDGQGYVFTLTARKGARRAVAVSVVSVVAAPAGPRILGPPPMTSIAPFPGGKVNAGDVARITALVTSESPADSLTMTWSATRWSAMNGSSEAPSPGAPIEPVDLLAAGFLSSSSIATNNLVLSPNALEPGWRYRLRLDVADANGAAAAFLGIALNTPPAGGSVIAFPANGEAMSTVFRLVAEAWDDGDLPLAYRFTVRVKGREGVGATQQLQDFSPLAEYKGTLPGGEEEHGGAVIVAVEVRDALGAISPPKTLEVNSTWPAIETEEAATAATAVLLGNAEAAMKAGGAEAALTTVSGACEQLENFKAKQRRRRLLSANGCVGGGGAAPVGAAATRASQREAMLNVTRSASGAVPATTTLVAGVADTAARVLSDPCESTASARLGGVGLVAALVTTASGGPTNDVALSAEGAANALRALSAAVTPAEAEDVAAAAAAAAATEVARAAMTAQLGPALPGETPSAVTTSRMSYVAARVESTNGNVSSVPAAATAGGAAFTVPGEALALGGGGAVDQMLLSLAYDAHAGAKNGNGSDGSNFTGGREDIGSAPRAAGTVSLVLRHGGGGGGEIKVANLTVPIAFSLHLAGDGEALRTPPCYIDDKVRGTPVADGVNATPPRERVVCSFFDETAEAYSAEGCATLPNPFPPGGNVTWLPAVTAGATALSEANASLQWNFTHPTLLAGCTQNVTLAADNVTWMRVFTGVNCTIEDPMNPTRCYWRRSTQAFEGCGCYVAPAVQCLCNHATDFSASSSPPKIKPISVEELMSISLNDVFNTWKVFAVVGGMFTGTLILGLMFERRDKKARRKLLMKFIDPSKGKALGFAIIQDIWTWHIDVQEMQFMFNNLHHPNTAAEVNRVIAEQIGTDDEEAINAKLEEIVAQRKDFMRPDVIRAMDRRRAAMRRASRAKEGLPQVPLKGDGITDALDAATVERIEGEIERHVDAADVGIRVKTLKDGRTVYDCREMLRLNAEDATDSSDADSDKEDEVDTSPKPETTASAGWMQSMRARFGLFKKVSPPQPAESSLPRLGLSSLTAAKKKVKSWRRSVRHASSFVPRLKPAHVKDLPVPIRNGPSFCAACGMNYVRFMIAFPIESLKRKLVLWKSPKDRKGVHLPFERAVGTALVYAFLDVKNVVGHVEMASRIYDAAQLPWLMPTGLTFPLLVAEFKAMLSGNLTSEGWMKRSNLWNIVALQNRDGSWLANDSLAGALKAQGPMTLRAPIDKLGNPNPTILTFYEAEELLQACPPALAGCAAQLGWLTVDSIWCTLLAIEGCHQNGLSWVLNPWDDHYDEFDILQSAWTWLEEKVNGDASVAAAVLDAKEHAQKHVTAWREGFMNTVASLHALRLTEKKEAEAKARAGQPPLTTRVWEKVPKGFAALGAALRWCTVELYKFLKWGLRLYCAAHMFFRAFLANPTDSFSGAERIVMQSTLYLVGLLVSVWFYYIKSTECCALLRQEIGCSANPLDACKTVPAGAGCAVFMSQKSLKPPGWQCTAFPDKNNGYHFLTVIAIQLSLMFPVKFILTKVFTAGGGTILEPHWRQAVVAAGMNLMEVYVAWMEVLFQLLSDPATALQKPELQKILKASTGAIKKTLNVCMMQNAMMCLGGVFYVLDRLGIYRKRKQKLRRFDDEADILDRITSVAHTHQTLAVGIIAVSPAASENKAASPEKSDTTTHTKRGRRSSLSRALFTKAAWSGHAAKVHAEEITSIVPGVSSAQSGRMPPPSPMPEASFHMSMLLAGRSNRVAPGAANFGPPAPLGASSFARRPASVAWGSPVRAKAVSTRGSLVLWDGATEEVPGEVPREAVDGETWLQRAVAEVADNVARVNALVLAERTLAAASALARETSRWLDDAAAEGGPLGQPSGSAEDRAHALAIVRASALSAGAVSASVALIRLPDEMGGFAEAVRGSDPKRRDLAREAGAAGAALLARLCAGNKNAMIEMRVDGGFDALTALLSSVTTSARPSPRCVADACAVVLAAVCESACASRAAIRAGLVRIVREVVGALSRDMYAGSVGAARRLRDDRDEADQIAGALHCFAELKSRERERDRAGALASDNSDVAIERFYVDVARMLPPRCDKGDAHVAAAAAAFAAVLATARHTQPAAERTFAAAGVVPELRGLPLGTPGQQAFVILETAFGPRAMAGLMERRGRDGGGRSVGEAAVGAAGAVTGPREAAKAGGTGATVSQAFAGMMHSVKEAVDDAIDTVGDFLHETQEKVQEFVVDASNELKTSLAVQTISLAEISARRRHYVRKLKWSSVLMQNLGWFLTGFTWFFGAWVIITYGVLIYRFLGPGEETTYITNWGMAFLINTFGLESLQIVGRKAFFIFVVTKFKKQFMKAQEALGWYEMYAEMAGMHHLVESGMYNSEQVFDRQDADDGDGDAGEDDGGE